MSVAKHGFDLCCGWGSFLDRILLLQTQAKCLFSHTFSILPFEMTISHVVVTPTAVAQLLLVMFEAINQHCQQLLCTVCFSHFCPLLQQLKLVQKFYHIYIRWDWANSHIWILSSSTLQTSIFLSIIFNVVPDSQCLVRWCNSAV